MATNNLACLRQFSYVKFWSETRWIIFHGQIPKDNKVGLDLLGQCGDRLRSCLWCISQNSSNLYPFFPHVQTIMP